MVKLPNLPMTNISRMLIMLSKLPVNKPIKVFPLGKVLEELVNENIEEGNGELREMWPYGDRFGLYHSIGLLNYSGLLKIFGYGNNSVLFVQKELNNFAKAEIELKEPNKIEYLVELAERLRKDLYD